jgi:hypothetical protein
MSGGKVSWADELVNGAGSPGAMAVTSGPSFNFLPAGWALKVEFGEEQFRRLRQKQSILENAHRTFQTASTLC